MNPAFMRRTAFVLLICVASALALQAADTNAANTTPEPYTKEEFAPWLHDLRRAEIIAFGVLPFTVFFSTIGMDIWRYSQNGWDTRYAPWPLKSAGAVAMTESEYLMTFTIACGSALVVALVDQIVVQVKRSQAVRREKERSRSTIEVERETPLPTYDPAAVPAPASPEGNDG